MSDLSVCMHKHARLGGSGGMLPQEILDALRLLLRPFWDRSRALVATWLVEYCIQFLACAFAKPADFGFPRGKVLSLRLAEQQVALHH